MVHLIDTLFSRERQGVHNMIEQARIEPNRILAMAIDGMDQQKTTLFKLREHGKDTENLEMMQVHLTCKYPPQLYIYDTMGWVGKIV